MSFPFLPPDWRNRLEQHRKAPRPLWMRIAGWIWLGTTALAVPAAIAVAVLLNNARFHRYLIRTVESEASQSLGVGVHLENFAPHFQTLSVDLYGVTIEGAAPYQNPPLLQVDHIGAGVRIVSVLHRAWYLDELQIDRPIAHVFVDQHGVSNLPTLTSSGGSNTSVFDLGIRHALLDRGEVYYNNRPTELAVDLRDVEFQSTFASALKQYSGELKYADGQLVYGTFRSIGHNLDAAFTATPSEFDLTRCRLAAGKSQAVLSATLNGYSNPSVQGHYDIIVDGAQMASLLRNAALPSGTVETMGSVTYRQAVHETLLASLTVNGTVRSRRLYVHTPSARASVTNVAGEYALAHGDAALKNFHAELLGGGITAQGSMKNLGGDARASLVAAVRGVSLADAARAFGGAGAERKVAVAGKLDAEATAAWGKTLDDLTAHVNATMHGQVSQGASSSGHAVQAGLPAASPATAPAAVGSPAALPLDSELHATWTAKNGELALDKSFVRGLKTTLTVNGLVSKRSSLEIQLDAGDLSEVRTIGEVFMPQGSAGLPALAGTASFHGNVGGSTSAPHLTGQLTARDLQYNGTSWKALRAQVDASPSGASLKNADLEPAARGHIAFNASAGLSDWSFSNSSPVQIDLHASQLNIADLARLANQEAPVTGTLDADLALHGTELSPVGKGSVRLTNVVAYQQPVRAAKLSFTGDGQQVQAQLSVDLPAGSIEGHGSVRPAARTYSGEVQANGIQLEKLQAVQAGSLPVAGTLGLSAKGQGSFDNPQVDATVSMAKLVAQGQTITGIRLQANVADHVANVTLVSSAVNTSIQAKARVNLTGDYMADASLDTQGIPLQPLLAVYAPDQAAQVTGQTEVHATLHGPLRSTQQLEAHVTIPVFRVAYGNSIQLAATGPIRADYKNGVVDIQRLSLHGTDTDLAFEGSIPTAGHGAMRLMLVGTVDLQLAQLFDPDIRSSGQLKLNINSNGPLTGGSSVGQISVVDASFASADLPVGLQHGNGVLNLSSDRLSIAGFQGTVGGGAVTAQGGVTFRPSVQFDLGLAAQGVRVLYPQGVRESVDANLRLSGTTDNASLGGSVNLSDLSFTPAFDLNGFLGQFSGGVAAPPSQGFAQALQLNIALRSTNNVNLVSRSLSLGGSANLQVRGTVAEPVILGRVNLTNGDVILNGTRFVLNGGTIQFINPSETQPVVNLSLNTSIQQYSIDLRFQGPVNQLRTEYSSDPALPTADIINLLAFGETTEASAQSTATTNQAAESLVASQVSSQVTSRLSRVAGISQLSISPVLAGSNAQGPPGAVITIQQRVTGSLFVNFSTNVASTQSQTIQGQYRISPKVSLSATRDPNGGFGFDALIKKSW